MSKNNCLIYENIFKSVDSSVFELLTPSCQRDIRKINPSAAWFRRSKYNLINKSSFQYDTAVAESSGQLTEFKLNETVLMGDYEQCLGISAVQTKFCKTYVRANEKKLPFDFLKSFGQGTYVCVLKSCTVADLNLLCKDQLFFLEEQCSDRSKVEFDVVAIVSM